MKIKLILFLTIFLSFGFDVGPKNFKSVTAGDILDVYVSEDAPEDLSELKDKRIGSKLYVLEVDNDNRLLKVIVTKETEKNNDQSNSELAANYINLQFNSDTAMSIPQYFTLDSGSSFEIKEFLPYILLFTGIILIILIFIYIYPRIKKSREEKKLKNILKEKVLKAKSRKDFEAIYLYRKKLKNILQLSEKDIIDFEEVMNTYQYRKDWTETDYEHVKKSINRLKEAVRI